MTDREITDDLLETLTHGGLEMLRACYQTSNAVLRQRLIQWVDQNEKSQSALLQLALKKGWALPSPSADAADRDFVRQFYVEPVSRL
ncbi:spore coat protein [Sulfobacillus harzensis]|uniref:Spore coat protein n=1 Tax=Sulfobacillus harzensis TaxID=2729629 RepID=A0A7Y0Q3L2_9FIRM|nr:spore coat protein [Sulfobacillus harzensis]NMP23510.1 spore coat protein [Sulfobacillus harzensis]